jgi:hypothetical protein
MNKNAIILSLKLTGFTNFNRLKILPSQPSQTVMGELKRFSMGINRTKPTKPYALF